MVGAHPVPVPRHPELEGGRVVGGRQLEVLSLRHLHLSDGRDVLGIYKSMKYSIISGVTRIGKNESVNSDFMIHDSALKSDTTLKLLILL